VFPDRGWQAERDIRRPRALPRHAALSVEVFPTCNFACETDSNGSEVASPVSPHRPPTLLRGKLRAIAVAFLIGANCRNWDDLRCLVTEDVKTLVGARHFKVKC
jgi:hypothetical protein